MAITRNRGLELRAIAENHIDQNMVNWDYSNWDGLICEEEITDGELEWMESNLKVKVTVSITTKDTP